MKDGLHFCSCDGRRIGDTMPYYHQGIYHLFYLLNGSGNVNVNIEHAWTEDLVHWHHAPTAVCREEGPEWMLDTGTIFTGSFLTENGLHHLWYTSWNPQNPNGREFIRHAVSEDLFSWRKLEDEVIAPLPHRYSSCQYRDFRDPCVIPDGKGGYIMFILANPPNVQKKNDFGTDGWLFGHLHSTDLVHWEQHEPVSAPFGDECPDYHCINGRHVLLSARKALQGDSQTGPYREIESGMDGPLTFAGKTVWDGKRHVWFGAWLGSALLVPREVFLQDDRIGMRMLPEIRRRFDQPVLEGESKERVVILPADTVCLLEVTISSSSLKKIYLKPASEKTAEIDAKHCRIRWGEDVNKPLHQAGEKMELQLIISQSFAELFIDRQTAFSFPLKNGLNSEWILHAPGAEMKWTLKTLNTVKG